MIAIQRLISGMIRRLCGKARQGKLAEYVCGDWGGRRVLMTGRPTTAFCHLNFNSTTALAMSTAHLIVFYVFQTCIICLIFVREVMYFCPFFGKHWLCRWGLCNTQCVFDVLDVIPMILRTFPSRHFALLNRGLLWRRCYLLWNPKWIRVNRPPSSRGPARLML